LVIENALEMILASHFSFVDMRFVIARSALYSTTIIRFWGSRSHGTGNDVMPAPREHIAGSLFHGEMQALQARLFLTRRSVKSPKAQYSRGACALTSASRCYPC
jgi:hypothetical protein